MAKKTRKVLVYGKMTLLAVIVLGVGLIVIKNWGYKSRFWPGASEEAVSTLWLMCATSIVSIAAFWIVLKVRGVFRDLARLRTERQEADRLAQQSRMKAELDEQERRLDAKLKQAEGERFDANADGA